jgi:hypothetical protein
MFGDPKIFLPKSSQYCQFLASLLNLNLRNTPECLSDRYLFCVQVKQYKCFVFPCRIAVVFFYSLVITYKSRKHNISCNLEFAFLSPNDALMKILNFQSQSSWQLLLLVTA